MRGLLLAAAAGLLVLAGCDSEDCGSCGPCTAEVERAKDGDTIVLVGGAEIRYLGVDTPEKSGGECLAGEAAQRNEDLVAGRIVRLEYGPECTDRFDRTLAFVTVNDGGEEVLVNEVLVEEGLAKLCRHEGTRYAQVLENAVHAAQTNARGIWGACDAPGSLGACD